MPLMGQIQSHTYTNQQLQSLRIPVGGIGSGNILLGGRGNIEFVEVFNRPNRTRRLEKTFFALYMKEEGKAPVSKLLERELFPPYHDINHKYVAGLPRMQEAILTNHFPYLQWQFQDEQVPLQIELEVINPMVPLDVEASSYPACKFAWNIENPTDQIIEGAIALAMENPIEADSLINEYVTQDKWQGITFRPEGEDVPVNFQGEFLMGTTVDPVEVQTHWFPGTWRDEIHIFWDDFSKDGHIEIKKETWQTSYFPTSYNKSTHRMASLLVPFKLQPGEKVSIPYYLTWYFPQRVFTASEVFGQEGAIGQIFNNHYATRYNDAKDVLQKFLSQEAELLKKSQAFADALINSSYPDYLIQSINTTMSNLISPLLQVTEDGAVHGFEGVLENGWCCPGTCTHVWNYEQMLAVLYPSLERKMREIEFLHNTFEDGFQTHRSIIPLGDYYFNGPAAADGHMGTIVRAYREWRLSGDDQWLTNIWPRVKLALEFAWTGSGEPSRQQVEAHQQAWDPEKIGILSGEQHNTYDINFYGPTSMTTSIYLAALKAGSEMARAMGDKKAAREYEKVYENGAQLMVDSLWNGEYFIQIIAEEEMPKYQYGNGCLSDQLLGQYLAFVSGLNYIAEQEKIDQALLAVFKNNFIPNLRNFKNVQRVYGLNQEAGVVLCTWPENDRPPLPFVYADEIWTGVEYQVAASLIYTGKVEEGLQIVKAVQDRYDGYKRNPFEHVESGVHYARSLASWSVMQALAGLDYDGRSKVLKFAPKIEQKNFQSFWSTADGWGTVSIQPNGIKISVLHGILKIKELQVGPGRTKKWKMAQVFHEGEELRLDL